jgi:AcrR family transcriptional regulator
MTSRNHRPTREEVRTSILQTAREIAASDGWPAVTVRKVAEQIGYTAPIIYEHFGSKQEMLTQILKQGYEQLYAVVVAAADGHTDSGERLYAMSVAYWDFAHDAPELYKLMYGMDRARSINKDSYLHARPLIDFVNQEFERLSPARATPENISALVIEGWSMLHGLVALDLSGSIAPYADGRKVLEQLIPDVLYALKRKA